MLTNDRVRAVAFDEFNPNCTFWYIQDPSGHRHIIDIKSYQHNSPQRFSFPLRHLEHLVSILQSVWSVTSAHAWHHFPGAPMPVFVVNNSLSCTSESEAVVPGSVHGASWVLGLSCACAIMDHLIQLSLRSNCPLRQSRRHIYPAAPLKTLRFCVVHELRVAWFRWLK
jgi:hypothetical protein